MEVQGLIETSNDPIVVGEFVRDVFLLHEEDERLEDTVHVDLQVIVLLVDQFLQLLGDVADLEELLPVVFLLQALWLDHQRVGITIDDSDSRHAAHDVLGSQQGLPTHSRDQGC